MVTEMSLEESHEDIGDVSSQIDALIEAIRDTNDEILQFEELRKHAEKLKEDLLKYFVGIMKEYKLDITIPADSLKFDENNAENIQAIYLNGSGVISYVFSDGKIKSHRLEDYSPADLMRILSVAAPILRRALRLRREECEQVANYLTKIKKYLTLVKEKFLEDKRDSLAIP